jgi:hypothetical protein
MKRPSEDQDVGDALTNGLSAAARSGSSGAVPSTCFSRMNTLPERWPSKAMRNPSGDHTGEKSNPGSVVRRML